MRSRADDALISALFAIVNEFGESCGENVMDMVIVGAVGAAVGVLIDAAIKGRKTVCRRPAGTMTVRLVPLASRPSIGLFLDVRPPWSRE